MSEAIKIKKGLNINLAGKAEKIFIKTDPANIYAVKPTDFVGITPKLLVAEGDSVKAGSPLFFDKYQTNIKFTSPVSGKVSAINRGERRKILEVVIEHDGNQQFESFSKGDPLNLDKETIINNLLNSGLWPAIKQRPYNTIAKPTDTPKAIYISGFDSSPLGVDYDFIMQDQANEFQTGIHALSKLTQGKVNLGVNGKYPSNATFANAKNLVVTKFTGPHPAGNVGVHIHKTNPISKGEVVWVTDPQSVAMIGRLFLYGHYDASKVVALCGSEVQKPRYYKLISGANIKTITKDNLKEGGKRFISGSVLTGSRIDDDGFIGYYDSSVVVIPEGDKYEFMGWLTPGFKKFSFSRTFFSWLTPGKEYKIDTNLKGGRRALMITGAFEKVFPMDIFPMQLIKATIIEDIDLMEKLGIYEVAEEDFALCEFIDTSKTDIQAIIRKGLDLMVKEMS